MTTSVPVTAEPSDGTSVSQNLHQPTIEVLIDRFYASASGQFKRERRGRDDTKLSTLFGNAEAFELSRDDIVIAVLTLAAREKNPNDGPEAIRGLFEALKLHRQDKGGQMGDMTILGPDDVPDFLIAMVMSFGNFEHCQAFVFTAGLDIGKDWEHTAGTEVVRFDMWFWAISCGCMRVIELLAEERIDPLLECEVRYLLSCATR